MQRRIQYAPEAAPMIDCKPFAAKPWRVVWGFGAYRDFPTLGEAEGFAKNLRASLPADWPETVTEPFDAVERFAANR